MRNAEFEDPRLVEVYDTQFRWSRDDDFFLAVVGETPGARVLDLGCGTGRLTLGLSAAGHCVTGVDPARASLAAARCKAGAQTVTWIEGTAQVLPAAAFDVAVMTSHVAQFFVTGDQWRHTLAHLHRALVPGGRLMFDSRDPQARAWERWNPRDSLRRDTLPDGRVVEMWREVRSVAGGVVDGVLQYSIEGQGELTSTAALRFRGEHELRASPSETGFAVDQVHGGWRGQPVGEGDGELLVLARRL